MRGLENLPIGRPAWQCQEAGTANTTEETPQRSSMGKRLQTVAAMTFMKTILMLFNFAFWVTGITILAVGIWMQVELYKYMELSTEFSAAGPYVLIVTGALIIVVGSLACCCTVKGQPVLLYIYGTFLLIIFLVELGAGVSTYAYRDNLKVGFDKGLNQTLYFYHNPAYKTKSDDFDVMQSTLECCGNHYYEDWLNTPAGVVPQSCCKEKNCDTTDPGQIYTQGCYSKVIDFLNENIGVVAGSAVAAAFFPLLGAVLSCCLAKNISKAKYEQMA